MDIEKELVNYRGYDIVVCNWNNIKLINFTPHILDINGLILDPQTSSLVNFINSPDNIDIRCAQYINITPDGHCIAKLSGIGITYHDVVGKLYEFLTGHLENLADWVIMDEKIIHAFMTWSAGVHDDMLYKLLSVGGSYEIYNENQILYCTVTDLYCHRF